MNIIADKIARRRKELGLTQKELSEKLNVSDKTLSRWETGKQIPDALTLAEIAKELDLPISEMYGITQADGGLADFPAMTEENSRHNKAKKCWKFIGAAFTAITVIAILIICGVNRHLTAQVTCSAEVVPMYKLTSYDHSILEWIHSCDTKNEEIHLLSRLRTDTQTKQDIACYLIYIPNGYESTQPHIRYRLGLHGKVLELDFKNTAEDSKDHYYLCYIEIPYDPNNYLLYLKTYLNGRPVDHSDMGNAANVNWEHFSLP